MTPDLANAVGGVRQHYRLVDTLNAAGISAAIVHHTPGFRCEWFQNQTAITYGPTVTERDLIVVPEEWVGLLPSTAPGVPKAVFNQNAYTTFVWGMSTQETLSAYRHPDLRSVIVVSQDNLEYMRKALPNARVDRIHYALDEELFHPRDPKRRMLSYMPRKRSSECVEVLALLEAYGALDGWEVVRIDGVDEESAARIIRASSVFLSFSYREGFGLPPAEAMAAGCVVIGFDGFGGRELFGDHAYAVPDGDVMACADVAAKVLTSWDADRQRFSKMTEEASRLIRTEYSLAAHCADVVPLFSSLMAEPRAVKVAHGFTVPDIRPTRVRRATSGLKRLAQRLEKNITMALGSFSWPF